MQLELQHDDPHDAIAAQLRKLAPRHERDSVEPDAVPITQDTTAPESVNDPSLHAIPLNDNAGDIINSISPARSGYRVVRGLLTVLLAVCVVVVAVFAWQSYGEEAKQRLSHLAPHLLAGALTQSISATEPQNAATQAAAPQPAVAPASAQDAAAVTPTQPSPSPATPAVESPPAQTAISPEFSASVESMARDIASLKQTVDELKAGQQQMERDIAKAAEHETHRKPTAQRSKPKPQLQRQHMSTSAATVRARTPYVPPQNYSRQPYPQNPVQREAYVPPPAPAQLPPQPGDAYAPRPPMPLR